MWQSSSMIKLISPHFAVWRPFGLIASMEENQLGAHTRFAVVVGMVLPLMAAATIVTQMRVGGGESEDWPTFMHDWQRTGHATSSVPDDLQLLWTFETGGSVDCSPAVANGKVYFTSEDDSIYAVNAADGSLVWSYRTPRMTRMVHTPSPTVIGGRVYVGSWEIVGGPGELIENAYLYALDAENGSLIWRFGTYRQGQMSGIEGAPAIVGNKIYFGSWNGFFYCLNVEDSSVIWSIDVWAHVWSAPAVVDGVVYFGTGAGDIEYLENGDNITYTGWVYALDAENGSLIWKYQIGDELGSSPVIADGKLFIESGWFWDNKIYCLDSENGSLIWSFETGGKMASSPAVVSGRVYFGSFDSYVYALDAKNGSLIWKFKTGTGVRSSPAVADGKVFIGSDVVYCLNANDGSLLWRYDTRQFTSSSPAIANGKIYIGDWGGKLYCFGRPPEPAFPYLPVALSIGVVVLVVTLLGLKLRAVRRVRRVKKVGLVEEVLITRDL